MWDKAYFQWVSPPPLQGAKPDRSPILEFPSNFLRTFFDTKRPNLTCGEKHISSGSARPLQEAGPERSPILEFPSFMRSLFDTKRPNLMW